MIHYSLSDIKDNINNTINLLVQDICKENKINHEKQNYKVLFSNEKILVRNNDIKFTSGVKKSLSFYGKVYLNKKGKIIESIYLEDKTIYLEPNDSSLLIMYDGVNNSTKVDIDEDLLHFYVAPSILLEMQDPLLWQTL
jgi:hypothetical protein